MGNIELMMIYDAQRWFINAGQIPLQVVKANAVVAQE